MRMPVPLIHCKAGSGFLAALCMVGNTARAEWQREDAAIAWRVGTNVTWRFCFESKYGKPFFHPLSVVDGVALTHSRPEDHRWHYGLWFSWKYINRVNYWEEDRQTGRAEGATRWTAPEIEARPDGSATIRLELTYTHPSGRVDLTERRELRISAPAADGSYRIDWRAHFTAGGAGAMLDRTPMPGEPEGKVNGGYAGLGLRLAGPPLAVSMVCSTGAVSRFESDRARPFAAAVAGNFRRGDAPAGAIAIFSDPANAGTNAPWYLVKSETMRFACAALLAPRPLTLAPGGRLDLHYRIVLRARPWTHEALAAEL